jgi:hypothetical protein
MSFFLKFLFIVSVNGVLCYFSQSVVLQGKQHVRGENIDSTKVEVKVGVQHFLTHAFKKFYIGIWFCMLIEDVMEVLTLLLLQDFIDQFFFIWGHEQCSMTSSQLTTRNYYYLKDLSRVYSTYQRLPYGQETKPWSLMMSQAKLFKIPRVVVFFGSLLENTLLGKCGVVH